MTHLRRRSDIHPELCAREPSHPGAGSAEQETIQNDVENKNYLSKAKDLYLKKSFRYGYLNIDEVEYEINVVQFLKLQLIME